MSNNNGSDIPNGPQIVLPNGAPAIPVKPTALQQIKSIGEAYVRSKVEDRQFTEEEWYAFIRTDEGRKYEQNIVRAWDEFWTMVLVRLQEAARENQRKSKPKKP